MHWILNSAYKACRFNRFRAVLIIFLIGVVHAQGAPTVTVTQNNGVAKIVLRWPQQVRIEHQLDGSELYISFNRTIENDKLDTLPARLPSLIEDVQYGYDSLLLRLGTGVTAKLFELADGIRIELTKFLSDAKEQRNQLDYLKALALYSDGRRLEAREILVGLTARSRANLEAQELLARIEEELGRASTALAVMDSVVETNSDPAWIRQQKQYLRRAYGDQLQFDARWLNTEKAETQFITQFAGRYNVKSDLSLSGLVENRKIEIDELQRIDGDVTAFNDNRQRAQFQLIKDWRRPQTTQLFLFAKSGERKIGAGISHTFGLDLGRSTASLIMNEPYWDLVEGIADGGSRSKLAIDFITQRIPRLDAAVGISINDYGIGSDADVASGIEYTATLQYFLREGAPFVGADYSLSGRHINEIDEKTNENGELFNPLPITSVEIHYLGLSLSDELFSSGLRYTIAGGYAIDRLGKDGPVMDVSLVYDTLKSLEVGLQSSAYPLLDRGQADFQFSIGGYVVVRF